MAEMKYDLLLHPTKKNAKVTPKPWYKERLREKYIKTLDPCNTSRFIDSTNWMFLKAGIDDFRNGVPPPVDDIFVKSRKGVCPVLTGGSKDSVQSNQESAKKPNFTKHETCYSKVSPMQRQRQENVEMLERALKQHPLALYPHLEECLPPELFEDVVGVLDPEMVVHDDSGTDKADSISVVSSTDRPAVGDVAPTLDDPSSMLPPGPDDGKVRNPYRWLPDMEESEKRDKKGAQDQRAKTFLKSEDDEHVKSVTQEFCDWVASLGGDSNNIEESTITSLFASGYETKPALSVPIHVVELANVPPELRMSAAPASQTQSPARPHTAGSTSRQPHSGESEPYRPSWVKYKYGAWYLEPTLWRRRPATEPMRDPDDTKDKEVSEAKQKSLELDYDLAPMHGVKLFKDFVDKKDTRRPEFLDHVADIKEQQLREEQLYNEAELLRQRQPVKATSRK
jgi:hypothetical protein